MSQQTRRQARMMELERLILRASHSQANWEGAQDFERAEMWGRVIDRHQAELDHLCSLEERAGTAWWLEQAPAP